MCCRRKESAVGVASGTELAGVAAVELQRPPGRVPVQAVAGWGEIPPFVGGVKGVEHRLPEGHGVKLRAPVFDAEPHQQGVAWRIVRVVVDPKVLVEARNLTVGARGGWKKSAARDRMHQRADVCSRSHRCRRDIACGQPVSGVHSAGGEQGVGDERHRRLSVAPRVEGDRNGVVAEEEAARIEPAPRRLDANPSGVVGGDSGRPAVPAQDHLPERGTLIVIAPIEPLVDVEGLMQRDQHLPGIVFRTPLVAVLEKERVRQPPHPLVHRVTLGAAELLIPLAPRRGEKERGIIPHASQVALSGMAARARSNVVDATETSRAVNST